MLPLLAGLLLLPAAAADIEVVLDRPVLVLIDGTPVINDAGGLSVTARGLSGGTHLVEARNLLGKRIAELKVEVADDELLRLQYRDKVLSELGRSVAARAAEPTPPPAPAAVPPPPTQAQASTGFGGLATGATVEQSGTAQQQATAQQGATTTTAATVATPAGGISVSVSITEGAAPTTAPAAPAAPSTLSSASFTGLDPVMFCITLDGRPVAWVPGMGSFVAPDLAPGKHAFVMYLQGAEALRADFTTEVGKHSACTILVHPFRYDTSCADGGAPLTAAAVGLSAGVTAGVSTGFSAAPPPVAPLLQPIDEPSLQALVAAVEDATFADDQVSVLRTAAANNHFTCAQVVRLLEPISFSESKVQATQALRPAILDPQNAHQVEQAFTFSSDKEKVRALFR